MKSQYAALLLTAALGIGASSAQAEPPPWAPAHGHRAKVEEARRYEYVYYPAQRVYYSPQEQVWFWMNGGNWQVGVNLPATYRVQSSAGVQITLASQRPYVEHVYVEEHYGRPWREKHGKEKHDKHNKHHDD